MCGTFLPHASALPFFSAPLKKISRILLNTSFALLLPIALASCTFADSDAGKAAPPPSAAAQQQEKVATPMDTFRALAPPEGFKFTPLFAETVKDDDARFYRLEQAVQSLRNDFDTVTPSLVRLVAVEKDMKELISQLQTLTKGPDVAAAPVEPVAPPVPVGYMERIPGEDVAGGTDSAAAASAAAEATAPTSLVTPEAASEGELPPEDAASPNSTATAAATAPVDAPAPAPSAAPAAAQPYPYEEKPAAASQAESGPKTGDVKAVRIGDHLDKTRIVLDLTAQMSYTARLENGGKRLVIDLPQANWATARQWDAMSAELVASYSYDNGKVVMDLLYPATIKSQTLLPPNGSPYQRLVIDLHSAQVHE